MSAVEVQEEAMSPKGLTAPLVTVAALLVIFLGATAYWWHMARVVYCTTNNLSLSLGSAQGTAGTTYMHAVLTNKGPGNCTISGYPAAFLTSSSGTVLGAGAAASALYTPVAISLGHGQSVHAVLGFPDAGNFSAGSCSQASHELKLYPPGMSSALETAFTQYSCPGFSITALQAAP